MPLLSLLLLLLPPPLLLLLLSLLLLLQGMGPLHGEFVLGHQPLLLACPLLLLLVPGHSQETLQALPGLPAVQLC